MVQDFGGRARFVEENFGDSRLAERFGVTRYPAIFVDSVLVATPNDFGFYGRPGGGGGRYAPLRSAASHERFRADLGRMIALELAGRTDEARARAAVAKPVEIASMPSFTLTGLDGDPVSSASLAGRPVLVEFWATWCPPCRGTLRWLGGLRNRYGDRVGLVAVAVESDEGAVRDVVRELGLPVTFAMGRPQVVRSFGDLGAVPTLFLFRPDGRTEKVFYGAPPTLHGDVEARLAALLAR